MSETTLYAKINSVDTRVAGSAIVTAASVGDTTIYVDDVIAFDPLGGQVSILGAVYSYSSIDDSLNTLTLTGGITAAAPVETQAQVSPYSEDKIAFVDLEDQGDALEVIVPHSLRAFLSDGTRDEADQETVIIDNRGFEFVMTDIVGRPAVIEEATVERSTTDGLPPVNSPVPTVIGGLGTLFIRWTGLDNADPVTYDVHVSPINGFTPQTDASAGAPVITEDFNDLTNWSMVGNASVVAGQARLVPAQATNVTRATNLHKNPRLGAATTGWSFAGASASATRQTSGGPTTPFGQIPTYSQAALTAAPAGTFTAYANGDYTSGNYVPVTAGTAYQFATYFQASKVATGGARLVVAWYSSANAILSTSVGVASSYTTATWTRTATLNATAPTNAVGARLYVEFVTATNFASGDTVGLSAASANLASDPEGGTYVDGALTSTSTTTFAWTGTANASSSTLVRPLVRSNSQITRTSSFDMTDDQVVWTLDVSQLGASGEQNRLNLNLNSTFTNYQVVLSANGSGTMQMGTDTPVSFTYPMTASYIRFRHRSATQRIFVETSSDALRWDLRGDLGQGVLQVGSVTPQAYITPVSALDSTTNNGYAGLDQMVVATNGTSATLALSTASTSTNIKTLHDGTPLQYGVTYYVKVVAKDADGAATPSVQGSGSPVQITSPDIAANYVYAGTLLADQIVGGTIQSDLLMSGSIKTASAGARVELSAFGMVVYDSTGTPTTLLGSDGTSTFKGQVQASTLTVTGGMSIRGTANEVSRSGTLNLASGITQSSNAPTAVVDFENFPLLDSTGAVLTPVPKSLQRVGSLWVVQYDDGVTRRFNSDGTFHSTIGSPSTAKQNFTQIDANGPGYMLDNAGNLYRDWDYNSIDGLRYALNDPMNALTNWNVYGNVTTVSGAAYLQSDGSNRFSGITSTTTYPFQGRFVKARLTPDAEYLPNQQIAIRMQIDSSNFAVAWVSYDGGVKKLYGRVTVGGVATDNSIAWNNSTDYVLLSEESGSIRFAQAAGPDLSATTSPTFTIPHTFTKAQLAAVSFEISAGDTDVDRNLIANPGFETNTTGWSGYNASLTRATVQANTGTASGQIIASANGDAGITTPAGTSGIPVYPGSPFTVSFYARSGGPSRTMSIQVSFFNATGSTIGGTTGYDANSAVSTGWTNLTVGPFIPPSGAAYAQVRAQLKACGSGEVYYFDDISVTYPTIAARIDDVTVGWRQQKIAFTRINTSQQPALGSDGTNLLISEYDAANSKVVVRIFDPLDMKTVLNTYTSNAVSGFVGPTTGVMRDSFDFGGLRLVVKGPNNQNFWVFTYTGTSATFQANESFPYDPGGAGGAGWDGANFWGLGTNGRLYKHTSIVWTDTGATKSWQGAFTWYDGNTTGGLHETTPSPRATITMKKRARLTITSPDIPYQGDTDDPDRIAVYLSQTVGGTLYQQVITASGSNLAVLNSATFSGTTPPGTNNFPDAVPAKVTNTNSTLEISGAGTIKATDLTLTGRLATTRVADRTVLTTSYLTTTTQADIGLSDTFTVVNAADVFLVLVTIDIQANTTGQSPLVIKLIAGGVEQSSQLVWYNPAASTIPRAALTQTWLLTGLTPGSVVAKVQASASTASNYRLNVTHSNITIVQVK